MAHHAGHIPHWLLHLGIPGLCLISFLDGSPIPLPIPGSADLLLLLLCAQHGSNPFLLAGLTIATSVAGGYLTWRAGKQGGEAMLHHFAPKRLVGLVTRWMRSHGGLTIAASAVLPPPVPLMPLLLGAGALGASGKQFLIAFSLARGLRYGFVAWIGAAYGRHVLHWWNHYLSKWSETVLWGFVGLLLAGIGFGIWQYRRQTRGWKAKQAEAG